jgi:protocatechuate 3,4-dioxygenase alpha subunit
MTFIPTASQTVGPFFNYALTTNAALGALAREGATGERIRLSISVIDGGGAPAASDAMIELWQADAQGYYAHALDPRSSDADPHFNGFGRLETDLNGTCVFETVKPGSFAIGNAPHINVIVLARGLLKQLYTRIYFAGDPANDHDPVLALVPEDRRVTLLAQPGEDNLWSIEIRLQGEAETAFFDL